VEVSGQVYATPVFPGNKRPLIAAVMIVIMSTKLSLLHMFTTRNTTLNMKQKPCPYLEICSSIFHAPNLCMKFQTNTNDKVTNMKQIIHSYAFTHPFSIQISQSNYIKKNNRCTCNYIRCLLTNLSIMHLLVFFIKFSLTHGREHTKSAVKICEGNYFSRFL
jgi:hypothetical protein